MSAAVTRAKRLEDRTNELTQPAKTSTQGKLEPRPVTEVTKVTEAGGDSISDQGMAPLMHAPCDDLVSSSENTLAMRTAPVAEESIDRKSGSTADVFPSDKAEHAQAQPVIKRPLRASKSLPEIKDPPPLVVPEFRPGSAFVSRITSSRKNLVALLLAVLLVCGGIVASLIPQISKSLEDGREEAVTKHLNSPAEPSNPVSGSGTNAFGTVEAPSTATTDSTSALTSGEIKDPAAETKGVESTSQYESAEVVEKGSAGIATPRGTESPAHRWSGNRVPLPSENKRQFASATSMPRPVAPARKQRSVPRAVRSKQQAATEEQPKPAPLRVEMGRSRSVLSTPAGRANEVRDNQPSPLSISSGKPKSKVIQWP